MKCIPAGVTLQALRNPLFSSFYTVYSDGAEGGMRCKKASSYTRRRNGTKKNYTKARSKRHR